MSRPWIRGWSSMFTNLLKRAGIGLGSPKSPHIFLPKRSKSTAGGRYLSVVSIAKNEGANLKEWLHFHRLTGVEHVFLYDDESSDNTADIVAPFVSDKFVTYLPWARFDKFISQQHYAYAHALCAFGASWRWMAFLDLDEFLFPARHDRLSEALRGYEDLPALAVPWLMFGHCGHKCQPPGLVVENYTLRAPFPPSSKNRKLLKWKSIVDPSRVSAVQGPHLFVIDDGLHGAYSENGEWIDHSRFRDVDQVSAEVFRLNHYFSKSEEEFARKLNLEPIVPRKHYADLRLRREKLMKLIEKESVEDLAIQRYVKELQLLTQS